ncbi:CRISPR-associated endonuclease Cas1 [Beggiatoa alba B18LD]|uniref:CRISPR-associated endonuclease Cas1 n=1 Tax=Beggiatoa alba B18LD TaxID=395493 RepID=I3CJV3_9GAMM|nr:CRISPR-associated endonuclease Cas1 [Beggiatoa alba]EIJ43896.1 CRISPR-associated endonuclease Cas1 [Beggiatoa alba B18LD]
MTAMTLLVDRRDAELSLSSNRQVVCLRYPDGDIFRIGINALKQIVVQGEVNLPTSLLRALHTVGVSVVLLPAHGAGEGIYLFPQSSRNIDLRLAQYRAFADDSARLALAKLMVVEKIEAQIQWLGHHQIVHQLAPMVRQVQQASDIAVLMGIEGSVAQIYFEKWRTLWADTWGFKARNRRPPRDPVNTLLSLGYTLAGHSVGQLVVSHGLELGIGFLHVPYRGRPSLALDVLERVRPFVDEWLWQQVEAGLLSPADFFVGKEGACSLEKSGRSRFYGAWYGEAEDFLQQPMRDSLAVLLNKLRQYRVIHPTAEIME